MADEWFEIASLEHFWIRRRFAVVKQLLGSADLAGKRICEIGCGHGLVQRQFELGYAATVDGMELNLPALEMNLSQKGQLYLYDIFDRKPQFGEAYDVIILFDVLEHINDDKGFLSVAAEMVCPGGLVVINVPARKELYSDYDVQAGHVRRYSLESLTQLAESAKLAIKKLSYWGLPLVPLLWMRKQLLKGKKPDEVIREGFSPRNRFVNSILSALSGIEFVPNKFFGTSVMSIAEKIRKEE
jgi:SAM-dependent methyltransferase